MHDALRGPWLAKCLHPARVLVFARLRSTNRTAAALLEAGKLKAPALVAASLQTSGQGRGDNQWRADSGSLCATFVLPAAEKIPVGQVPLRAGLAAASVIAGHLAEADVKVKWPNDILVGGAKIAGILCSRQCGADVIGIGINVRTDLTEIRRKVRTGATSLAALTRRVPRRDALMVDLWSALSRERVSGDWLERYQHLHALHNRRLSIETDGRIIDAICLGVDDEGRLLLDSAGSRIALTEGTILHF